MKKHTTTFQFRPNGIKSLLLMLLLLVMGVGESVGQIREGIAPEAIVEGVPYRLVIPASEGAVMALDHSDYSSINNQSYGVVRHTWNAPARCEQNFYGRKDEVYFFKKVAGTDDYCIKGYFNTGTKDAPVYEVRYLYGDGWKVSLKNESELNTNTKNYRFTISKSVSISGWEFTADGTDYVYIKCQKAQYVAPGRGFSEGSGVFTDAAKDRRKQATTTFLPWKIVPWDPLADLKDLIDNVQNIVNTASVGLACYQVPSQSYIYDLSSALSAANNTYSSLYKTYGSTSKTTLMDDATFTSAASTAVRTLVAARATYLAALNPISPNRTYTFIHEATGKVLQFNDTDALVALASSDGSDAQRIELVENGGFYSLKSGSNYLRVVGQKLGSDGNNGAKNFDGVTGQNDDLIVQWGTTDDERRYINIVRFDNEHFGLQFEYHTEGTYGEELRLWQGRGFLAPTCPLEPLRPFMENGITNPYSYWKLGLEAPTIAYDEMEGKVAIGCPTMRARIYYVGYDDDNGTDPTLTDPAIAATLTEYTGPFDAEKPYYKAIAVLDNVESEVITYGPIDPFHCVIPNISYNKTTKEVTITSSTTSADIYYIIGNANFSASATNFGGIHYDGPFTLTEPVAIKAIAVKSEDWDTKSPEALWDETPHYVNSASEMTSMNLNYVATPSFVADATVGTETNPFTGSFDGDFNEISLSQPLFGYVNGGIIKNVIVSSATFSGSDNVGAIANVVVGMSEKPASIYNCGILDGSIGGSGNVGGLVGALGSTDVEQCYARVINCFSYANITGGSNVGGIVGYNNYASTKSDLRTMVMNCIMYGDITGGTNRSPVYGGLHTSNNQGLNEYNYWRSKANLTYTAYNDQLAIGKDEYLTRFPFYRHILNTHRELAAFFMFHDSKKSSVGTAEAPTHEEVAEIGHWVLKPEVAPYPIIEPWLTNTKRTTLDINANLPTTTERYAGKKLDNISADKVYRGDGTQVTTMGDGGMLHVNVSINGSSFNVDLPITDMDTLRYDYTWGKVILPFANEFNGWSRDYSKICTGWKINSVTKDGSVVTTFKIPANEPYNFADRDNPQKDIYDVTNNPYIFAQGGYYIVPYGVTAINIEANFAKAFYLSDAQADFGYDENYANQTNLGWTMPTTYHGQTVHTTLTSVVSALSNSTNPHSQAIVLVGNFHYNNKVEANALNTSKAVTIMSVDEDNNQEPDYGWYSYMIGNGTGNSGNRSPVPPLRFDFVPNIGIGMAARVNSSEPYPSIGIWHTKGWFELTETSLSLMSECEIASSNFTNGDDGSGNNRWIANSGYFIQIVRCRKGNCSKLSYIQIGGNAFVEELYPGSHSDDANTTTLVPINVTGGEIKECYMTGYKAGASATGSNIRFWCAGGKIHKFLGAYMEKPSTAGVNMTAKVDHARIYRFFGGGTSSSAQITGNIDITMNNSKVDFYCGGPEFGDMTTGKTVTTRAWGSTFGKYYGAGFGGTSITYNRETQQSPVKFNGNITFPLNFNNYKRLTPKDGYGVGTCYKFEYIFFAGGDGTGVARFYTGYARFSLATTGSVTNTLNNCIIKDDFYGAGCQGMVSGTVTSTLAGCTAEGSVFGGGYKAENNTLDVYPNTQPTYSVYTKETGLFSDFGTVNAETWEWKQGTAAERVVDEEHKTIYCSNTVNMSELGNVTGAITLNIEDGTTVTGSVFGGGNESKSLNNAIVNVTGGTITHDVYGGGNKADVNGDTQVNLLGGIVNENVYGGGRGTDGAEGIAALVGSTQVNLNGMDASEYKEAYSSWGLEQAETDGPYTVANTAKGCVVGGSIFGCNNINGTPQGDATVHVYKTQNANASQIGNDNNVTTAKRKGNYDVTAVYGGGNLAAYIPASADASTYVIIDGCDLTSIETVYGGGNAASTPATDVTVNGTFEIKELFGGGNGKDRIPKGGDLIENPGANVGYQNYSTYDQETGRWIDNPDADTKEERLESDKYLYGSGAANVNIYGGTIHQVFGGSNMKGNVRISAVTLLDDNNDCEFCVDEAYGGGKSAPMDAEAKLLMSCIPGLKNAYGGAEEANIEGNVTLTITNGNFERVFGGNNISGTISGTITVNIEETGCHLITIGQLYGGGNQAAYEGPEILDGEGNGTGVYQGPTLNVRSFTSIGEIYGGGYGKTATVKGDTYVNVNVCDGKDFGDQQETEVARANTHTGDQLITFSEFRRTDDGDFVTDDDGNRIVEEKNIHVYLPPYESGIGNIGNVYGGGNAAKVDGSTHVNIGTVDGDITFETPTADAEADRKHTVKGVNIVGNVYGGGNAAEVTGNTNVTIGK